MKKVISEISGAVFSLPWLIAKDNGLFEAEGIDMEFVNTVPAGKATRTENPADMSTPSCSIRRSRKRGYPSTGLEKRVRSVGPMKVNREPR